MTPFNLQEPGSTNLPDAINEAATDADCGFGVFAFASAGGVRALFSIPMLTRMLANKKRFHLIVGVDSITNVEALLSISDQVKSSKGLLTAEVFCHANPASTFHPKFLWFTKSDELRLLVGSGNLTLRGMGQKSLAAPAPGNWEAFSVHALSGNAGGETLTRLEGWIKSCRAAKVLRSLDDESVKIRAMANGLVRYSIAKPTATGKPAAVATSVAPIDDSAFNGKDILIRELPKTRPGQADIGKAALTDFFGFDGIDKDVLLQHVSIANALGATEQRRLFVNASQNYRLELQAMTGLPYAIAANGGRMVLIAMKLDRRSFRYTIIPVNTPEHSQVVLLLGPLPAGKRYMREKQVTAKALQAAWPTVPRNLLPTISETPAP